MNYRATWKVLIPLLGLTALIAVNVSRGQNDPLADSVSEFEQLDARYRQILSRNPKPGTSFDRWYRLHLDAGRLKELVEDCTQRAEKNPESGSDQILLALVCSRTGNLERALQAGERARELSPENYVPALLTGELLQRQGKNSAAAIAYADAIERKPPISETVSIARRLTRVYFVDGDSDRALEVWSKVEQRFPDNISILTEVAQQLAEQRQFDEAILRWEQIRGLAKSDLDLRMTAGIEIAALDAECGRTDEAVVKFNLLLDQVRPDSWLARHVRQKIESVLTEEGGYRKFAEFLRKRLEDHPDDVDTRLQLASALERTGEFDEAELHYRQALKQAPGRRDVRKTYIDSLESRDKIDEAAEQARVLTELDAQDVDAWRLYGRLVMLQGQAGDPIVTARNAAEIWSRIPAIRSNDAQLALQTAELCRASAFSPDVPEAEAKRSAIELADFPLLAAADGHYREAIRREPGNPRFRVFHGEFLHSCGQRDRAIEVWSDMVRVPFDTVANHILLAETFQRFGHLDSAIFDAREACSREPENVKARQVILSVLSEAKRYEEALVELNILLPMLEDPELKAEFRKQWVELTVKSGNSKKTLLVLKLKHDSGKADTAELWKLGLLYEGTGQLPRAIRVFENAVKRDPDNLALRHEYAEVLQSARQFDRAVAEYRWVVEHSPRPPIRDYERIIDLQTGLKQFEAARQTILAMLRVTPSNPEAYRRLADVNFLMERFDDGLEALRQAVRLAPSGLEIRLELVHRLVETSQHDEALEHCRLCFELMTELEERLSLIEIMMNSAEASRRSEETLIGLKNQRDQQKRPRDYTLCLIAAYRHLQRTGAARTELERLLDDDPDDMEALKQIAEVCDAEFDWDAALRWQQEIVKRDDSAGVLLQLSTYHRRAGDDDLAEIAWKRALPSKVRNAGTDVSLRNMDRYLVHGQYALARQTAEGGLNQDPENPSLRYRLGLTLLLQGEYAQAHEAFEAALRSARSQRSALSESPQQRPTTTVDVPPEYRELEDAKNSFLCIFQFNSSQLRSSDRMLLLSKALSLQSSLREIEIWSLVGSFCAAEKAGPRNVWIHRRRAQSIQNLDRLHEAGLMIAATSRRAEHEATLIEVMKRLPDDPVPHLAYLVHLYDPRSLPSDFPESQKHLLPSIKASYDWVGEHRPALRPHVVLSYARQLMTLGDRVSGLNAYIESLQHPDAEARRKGTEEIGGLKLVSHDLLRGSIEPLVVPALVELLDGESTAVTVSAAKTLGGLGSHAQSAVAPLIRLFSHPKLEVRNQAVSSIAHIGGTSVPLLLEVVENSERESQLSALRSLVQLGRTATLAVPALIELLSEEDPELQLRSMDVLAAIGPAAKPAVPLLVEQLLSDDRSHQRRAAICLGKIGPAAREAIPELRKLLTHEEPFVRRFSSQAIREIVLEELSDPRVDSQDATAVALRGVSKLDVRPLDWPQWGGWSGRNSTPEGVDIPEVWDLKTGKNIKWTARLGSVTYGPPAVANGKIYVGTNNGNGYLARYPKNVDLGVLLCFDEESGQFLWQLSCPKLATGRVHDWPFQGIPSTPLIDGDRLWLVTNRGEVVCLDTQGFRDNENDGPFTSEVNQNLDEADIVWSYDMMSRLGVSQHNMANCSMTCAGDLLFVCTSNGVDETHLNLPAPHAPSFMAMNRWTGKVIWTDKSPGKNILHGQWCSPCYAEFDGIPQVIFGGGDGWLYSFVPEGDGKGNSELIWKFDCNPKDSKWVLGGAGTRNNIIAFPAVYDGLLYVAVGQDPEHGEGPGHLWCIDPAGYGDVSPTLVVDAAGNPLPHWRLQAVDVSKGERAIPNPDSAVVWHFDKIDVNGDGQIDYEEEMHRTTATPVIKDGLVYVADFSGIVYCLDAKFSTPDLKPKLYWTYDMFSPAWDSPLVVDGKVYVGDEDGDVAIFKHGTEKKLLHEHYMEHSVKSAPIVANNVLYITTLDMIYAIEKSTP